MIDFDITLCGHIVESQWVMRDEYALVVFVNKY